MIINNIRNLRYPLLIALMAASVTTFAQNPAKTAKTEANNRPSVFLSPNPFRDVLFLTSEVIKPRHKIEIYSLIGELLFSKQVETVVRLPKFPRGIYLARVTDEKGQQVISQKIVKL
ncbi:MAG: T9SS type A sorting domain-containing protein [Bacteroidetes bacterium]|nr:T9SS type A sorting domain-containing protein [Bacteroidota bacterium]